MQQVKKTTPDLDAVWLIVADVDLVASIAGRNAVRKLHRLHDAELVQDGSRLLTEYDHPLHLALHHDDVAQTIDGHSTRILQDVRTELTDESTVPCEDLHLHK